MGIDAYLRSCRELAVFCSQNGWIDNDTLKVEILERNETSALAAVTFEEIIVKAAGCVGRRLPCHGRVRIALDRDGEVRGLEIL